MNVAIFLLISVLEVIHVIKAIFWIPLYTEFDRDIGYLPPQGYWHNVVQLNFTYILLILGLILSWVSIFMANRLVKVSQRKFFPRVTLV